MKKDKSNDSFLKILIFLAILLILIGTSIFFYPNISNYFAQKNHTEAIRIYDEIVENTNKEDLQKELEKAKTYNENLAGDPVHDPFIKGSGYALPDNYKDVLNITNNGIMAYIEIPKINVYLPIYHGTSEDVLENGVRTYSNYIFANWRRINTLCFNRAYRTSKC